MFKCESSLFFGLAIDNRHLHIFPQPKNPTNVGLDVVEWVKLFKDNHSYPVLPHNLQYKMDMEDRVGWLKC